MKGANYLREMTKPVFTKHFFITSKIAKKTNVLMKVQN